MEWISVKEISKLPESLEEVLFSDGKEIFKGYRFKSEVDDPDMWFSSSYFDIDDVTYWMPLPNPPGK